MKNTAQAEILYRFSDPSAVVAVPIRYKVDVQQLAFGPIANVSAESLPSYRITRRENVEMAIFRFERISRRDMRPVSIF